MRTPLALLLGASLLLGAALPARAQGPDWRPPSRTMPSMPQMTELQRDWRSAVGPWLSGVTRVSGVPAGEVRAEGETTPGSGRARFVRFLRGHFPLGSWQDRNGDGRCDMVELFRDGARVVQAVDADYDGTINKLRFYDASGALVRELDGSEL